MAVEKEGFHGIVPKKQDEHDCKIEKITMNILENERKRRLAGIFAPRFANRASRRIKQKSPIQGFSIVVASSAKAERPRKDQQRGRKFPPVMQRIDERRIEW